MHVTLVSTINFKSYLQHASESHLFLDATWCHLKLFVHVGSISQSNIQCQVAPKSHPRGATWVRLGCDLNWTVCPTQFWARLELKHISQNCIHRPIQVADPHWVYVGIVCEFGKYAKLKSHPNWIGHTIQFKSYTIRRTQEFQSKSHPRCTQVAPPWNRMWLWEIRVVL